ncbi:hypothetical protein ACFVUS_40720 [Nocardia sp. NPDC058058]|uniref:hypothetical protein n=1 Tax=Nocardia sp. NPDC058058 TaxID=3346317 RepID=UPI0036DE05CC
MSMGSAVQERYWKVATLSVAVLLVAQAMVFVISVAIIDLDGPDLPLRAFLITNGVSVLATIPLLRRGLGEQKPLALAAVVTAGIWLIATLFEILLYSGAGIVW